MTQYTMKPSPVFSIPSILSAICAILSFTRGAAGGFILAILAIVFGAFGLLLSFFPGKRGGLVSLLSILAGAFGIIAAIFKLVL